MSIKIEPIKLKEFEVKQSKYDVAPKIPFRSVILQNMILNIYKNCFSRIYMFRPSFSLMLHGDQFRNILKKK